MVALRLSPTFDMIEALREFFRVYPLDEARTMILAGTHQREIETGIEVDIVAEAHQPDRQEIAEQGERLAYARERMIETLSYYAEKFEKIGEIIRTSAQEKK